MIPVFNPEIGQEEITAVTDALTKGEISGSFGKYIPAFEDAFAAYCGCKYGVAVSSGTTALHLAVAAAGIGSGHEVMISASTNIATALAVKHNGAIPVPIDSEKETWNLDIDLLERHLTSKTKAIIPVHLFGHPVQMEALMSFANKHGLIVIEDCAESHGATVNGKMTGSFGQMGCFSFYANKIITTGEGGMIITDDPVYAEKLRLLRNLAFTKPRFYHEVAGYNFRMTGYQAAMGVAQLSKINRFIDSKRRLASLYNKRLINIPGVVMPNELPWAKHVYWMYAITIEEQYPLSRDALIQHLQNAGIETRTFFCPMNIQPCLMDIQGYRKISCPVAEEIWAKGLYLPSSTSISEAEIDYICNKIAEAI